jgi:hypothetical protein
VVLAATKLIRLFLIDTNKNPISQAALVAKKRGFTYKTK